MNFIHKVGGRIFADVYILAISFIYWEIVEIGTLHVTRVTIFKHEGNIMENFDILENSKTKDFIRFILALSAGVILALSTVLFLGIISLWFCPQMCFWNKFIPYTHGMSSR